MGSDRSHPGEAPRDPRSAHDRHGRIRHPPGVQLDGGRRPHRLGRRLASHHEPDALLGSVSDLLFASREIAPDAEPEEVARHIRDRAGPTRRQPTEVDTRAEVAYEPATGRSRIFLSYRRSDASAYAGRLYDSLVAHFGGERVAMDIDTIQAGVDFRAAIQSALASSSAMIAIIGRSWIADVDETGRRRLDNPDDLVRMELAAAFEGELPVIPVLVGGARMPSGDELPLTSRA